ncbi:MAG: HAD-IB family phosphatase [Oscillospiraceae bacterium]|nr:HAD-IB family phosphatase [Oscillospiraceae bacterium]
MKVYDFDRTVFHPDSSVCFFRFCLKKYPFRVLPVLPKSLVLFLRYRRGDCGAAPLKEQLFSFLKRLDDVDSEVAAFWSANKYRLQPWYLKQKREDDLIISASPEFLLRPLTEELGVRLIATRMDRNTGRIDGENCHDREKVLRFRALYQEEKIEAFYSDSLSDAPLAELAEEAWLVKKGSLSPWPK